MCRKSSTPSPDARSTVPRLPHNYRLAPARAGDAALLAAMSQAHIESGLKPAWGAARIRWHVRDADSVVLTSRTGATIAGFAIMRYGDDVAHLNLLAVDPAHRRRGIARALVRWLEETALTAGTFIIGLELRAGNEAARALYLADLDNRRVRRIELKTGIVSTVAGNGEKGVPADGAEARSAPLVDPRAIALDGRGNLYILERSGNALRVVDRSGRIRTVAGTGERGDSGDGGDARKAKLNGPKHLCVDREGNVLIADTENHRIRLYRPGDGTIKGVAGTGRKGTAGLGGAPRDAELNQPHGVTIGPGGILYICDSSNNRILKVVP